MSFSTAPSTEFFAAEEPAMTSEAKGLCACVMVGVLPARSRRRALPRLPRQ